MNKFWTRAFVFAIAFLLLLFFSNDFGMIDIQKTAIVVAVGIDKSEEENKFDVTAQIAVPAQSGGGGGGGGNASNVTVKGAATVGEAVAELNRKTGWYPTLVHCRLVLLGADTAEDDVFKILDYFLRSEFVEDSCLVSMCEKRAEDIFQAQSPIGELTASAVAKVLSHESQKTGLVSVTNLRDFAEGYYSKGKSGFLPILALKKEAENDNSGANGGEQSTFISERDGPALPAQGASGSGSGKGGESKADVFDASQTMLFYKGKRAGVLKENETLAYNLADTSTDFAFGDVTVSEKGEEVTYNLKMKIGKKKKMLAIRDGVPVFTFLIRANAQVADANKSASILEIAKTTIVPDHVLRAAEERFASELSKTLKTAAEGNCDLFGMKTMLYRFHRKSFDGLQDSILQKAKIVYDIQFDTLR